MRTIAFAAFAVLATGCPNNGLSVQQYLNESFHAACTRWTRCGDYHSEAACDARFAAANQSFIADLFEGLVAAGKVKFDGVQAKRCLDAQAAMPCDSLASPEECASVVQGLVSVGGECTSMECVPEAYCTYQEGLGRDTDTCPGTCKARVAEGGTASSSSACATGLVYSSGKCTKPRHAGESCGADAACEPFLLCSEGTCKVEPGEGEACTTALPCSWASYLDCAEGTCRVPADLGESCGTGGAFACKLDLFCDRTFSDVPPTCKEPKAEGQSCLDDSGCKDGLACDVIGKTCARLAGVGQSCNSVRCEGSSYCDSATRTCLARAAVGASCQGEDECVSGARCTNGKCRALFTCP